MAQSLLRMPRIDGRWFLWGSHLFLFEIAVIKYDLPRTITQFVTAYIAAIVTELGLNFWLKKYPTATLFDRILSAVAESAGLLLLVSSSQPYFYAIASIIAVASKYFLTRHDGIHIFNPTNFAIVIGFAIFSTDSFTVWADEYSRHSYPIFHVIVLGTFAVIFGKAYCTTLGYFAGLLVIGGITHIFYPYGFMKVTFPEIGAFGMIFAFLMITDPKTTPGRNLYKFIFGLSVAGMMMTLRYFEICFPHFLGLFMVTTAMYGLSFIYPQIYAKRILIAKTKKAESSSTSQLLPSLTNI